MPLEAMDMMRGYAFWRDCCAVMTNNVCEGLRLAGERITVANIIRFVESLPKSPSDVGGDSWRGRSYCFQCLLTADKRLEEEGDLARAKGDKLSRYFLLYFPERGYLAQETMIDSVVGILDLTGAAASVLLRRSPLRRFGRDP
jgi:hypothetical protein